MKFAPVWPPYFLTQSSFPRMGMHMALAQHVLTDSEYARFYTDASRVGQHVILDNGAAEGETVKITDLVKAANLIEATEVVLPDVMFDANATFELAEKHAHLFPVHSRIFVAHGDSPEQAAAVANKALGAIGFRCLGIPKHLEKGGHRVKLLGKLVDGYPALLDRVQIHLLGIYEKPFKEPKACQQLYPHIRSLDTGAPIAYAQEGYVIDDTRHFSLHWRTANLTLARKNTITYSTYLSQLRSKYGAK